MKHELKVQKGICHALYAYDVGLSINLEKSRQKLASGLQAAKIQQNRRAPRYFDYRPAPLLVTQDFSPCRVGDFQTAVSVDFLLYDFGGISVSYEIPFEGGLDTMRVISCTLSETDILLNDSRKRVAEFIKVIGDAVAKPCVADLTEDYAIFQLNDYETPCPPHELHVRFAQELAQVLRAEHRELSDQEVSDAIACRISYGKEDVTMIDWNAALVFDRDADDVRAVLEFANIELLEMRHLDHQLDDALDRAYEAISKQNWVQKLIPGSSGASVRSVSEMQVDGAILFERVSNAPKLLGDQYLARVYRLAAQRFHLAEWSASSLRKLDAIESIYKQMHDRAASWRMEMVEWIVVILILLELIVLA